MGELPKDLPAAGVAEEIGLPRNGRRYGCPACRTERDKAFPRRGPLWIKGTRWACSNCGERGDAITLIAWATTGQPRPRGKAFAPVLQWLSERNHVELAMRAPDPSARAPQAEVRALLCAATPVAETRDQEVLAFLRSRGLDPARIPAGVLPAPEHPVYKRLTWVPVDGRKAPWWPASWSRWWRLAVPAWTGTGELGGLHARDVTGSAKRKATWPLGVDCGGLLFADPALGRGLLRGEAPEGLRVLIAEGLPDFLYACQEATSIPGLAVLGIESGSAPALRLVRFPRGARIYTSAHVDKAGDTYATAIAEAVAPRAVRRLPLSRRAA